MKNLLLMFSILALAGQSREYQYNNPHVSFQQEDVAHRTQTAKAVQPGTTLIKGSNGKDYEVTMTVSRKIYEKRLPPMEEVFVVQQLDQPAIQQSQFHQQQVANSSPKSSGNGNFQHLNFNSNQYNNVVAVNNAQNHYNQFQVNSNHQHFLQQQQLQQQIARAQQTRIFSQRPQNQQAGYFYRNAPQQQQQQQQQQQYDILLPQTASSPEQNHQQRQQQQQHYPQQYEEYLQQPLRNNNLPNSNNLLNDLVNNHKYVSQSEATQLDVYAFKQINDNLRPFTRTITKCDVSGQCEPQIANAEGNNGSVGNDFHHQQVLKQTKALVESQAAKCENKFNYQFTGNALTDNVAKAQRGIPMKKGSDLKDRRLFPYSEVAIRQYPQN